MNLKLAAILTLAASLGLFRCATGIDAAATPSWGLDRIDQRALPLDNSYTRPSGLTGRGVTFYGVDTGIYSSHAEFAGRIVDGYTRVSDGLGSSDCHGHGTHTAGTAAGATTGVAPGMTVVPVRVYGCSGTGWTTDLIAGIRWAIDHHQPGVPAVMNISTSGPLSNQLNWAVQDAVVDGIVVVVAAGNNGRDACSYSPGAAPDAITVGGTEPNDTRLSISNYGRCVDIFAPGAWITSAWATGSTSYRSLKGTSFASPHVAGIAGLILEANPSYTPAQVTDVLKRSATSGALVGLDTASPNLLASTLFTSPPPATTTTTTTVTASTTTAVTASTTTVATPTTAAPTTLAPRVEQVTARRVGRGYFQVSVRNMAPSVTFAVRATSTSPRINRSLSWLVTSDSSGSANFFVRSELSTYSFSIIK